jgi:hypothetical protein
MPKRTVMRSVRIPQELNDVMRRDAESRGISFSSLVSEIFTKYVEWDRLSVKFGMISIPKQACRKLCEILSEEQASTWGKDVGSVTALESAQFWYKKHNTRTFLKLIELASKYSNSYQFELEKTDEREYTITVHHEMNEKFSIFLENWFKSAVKLFVGVTPRCEVNPNSIVVSFRESESLS